MNKDKLKKLKENFKIEGEIIGLTYSNKPASGGSSKRKFACKSLSDAKFGKITNVTRWNSSCPGGKYFLGFGKFPKRASPRCLVEIDKFFCNILIANKFYLQALPVPSNLANYVVVGPIEKSNLSSDIVIFIEKPIVISKILSKLAYYGADNIDIIPFGPTCYSAIASPIVKFKSALCFGELSSRKICGIKDEELILSLIFNDFRYLLEE